MPHIDVPWGNQNRRANPSWKQNLFITGLTWAAGAFVGVAMQVVVAVFV